MADDDQGGEDLIDLGLALFAGATEGEKQSARETNRPPIRVAGFIKISPVAWPTGVPGGEIVIGAALC